jgi:hypothetical protein
MKLKRYVLGAMILASSAHAQIEPDAATVAYFNSKSFGEMTVFYGMTLDKAFLNMEQCAGSYGYDPITFSIVEPLTFAAGNTHPVAGKWTYRFNFKRCGSEKIYNAMWQARLGAMPMPAALPPGMTRADLSLAMTIKNAVASAGLRDFGVPQECRSVRVLDTRVTLQPTQLAVGGVPREGVWEEEWTAHMCGVEFKAPICLVPMGSGRGTNWIAKTCPK